MAKDKFLLVNLQEDKAKKLAQVISNASCRKILDYLADKDATEEQVSRHLGVPMSTVHYNLQHLLKAGLVIVEEFHYSKKGREVKHYKLANKYIIIASKESSGILDRLKSIVPAGIIGIAGSAILYLYLKFFGRSTAVEPVYMAKSGEFAAQRALPEAAPMAVNAAVEGARVLAEEAVQDTALSAVNATAQASVRPLLIGVPTPDLALWFLFGAVFVVLVFVVFEIIRRRSLK